MDHRSRHDHSPCFEQVVEVKLKSDAEHQKDDADLGQLVRQFLVGDEAGCVRSNGETGKKIADDGR